MLVVCDLDVLLKPVPSRMLIEYRAAGIEYRVLGMGDPEDLDEVLRLAGLPSVTALGSESSPSGRVKVIEEMGCSRPGVYVTSSEVTSPKGWGIVRYLNEPYYVLIDTIWTVAPESNS